MFSSFLAALVGFSFSTLLVAPGTHARFASIQFSSVKQCDNFTVTFQGGRAPAALPLSLSVLPINGSPIFIPLPSDAWNSTSQTGAAITFLPFPHGTEFIASLDDADGRGTALVSDVLVIDPSDSGDTSCLPSNPTPFVPRYAINGSISQCESFSVDYNHIQNISDPAIRAFVPKGASFPIREINSSNSADVDTYLMDVPRNSMVLLLFKDAVGHAETTPILPVLGDIDSDLSCVPYDPLATAATLDTTHNDESSSTHVTPKVAIIVVVVAVAVVVLVVLAMLIWYFLHRRKHRQARRFSMLAENPYPSPRDPEKQVIPAVSSTLSPISPTESGYGASQQFVRNPPYTRMGSALITPTSPDPKDPFGERTMGSILGPLSARESLDNSRLGATALSKTDDYSPILVLQRSQHIASEEYASARSSTFDSASEYLPGTSPYIGRLAVTPDNSLASHTGSVLRGRVDSFARPLSLSSGSVTSVEIDRILEMATIYGAPDMSDLPLPQPVLTTPATLRSSAYMAGRESRRASFVLSVNGSSPAHSRNNSTTAGALVHTASHSTLRLAQAFREPPLAPLPSSPLPSPGARVSFDAESMTGQPAVVEPYGLLMPRPPQVALARSTSSATRQSVYSMDGESDDELQGFVMIRPPIGRS